jgi:thiol-disulfide isomerase/thioredoxin/predicted DNA-binding protein (UPF0251 family)
VANWLYGTAARTAREALRHERRRRRRERAAARPTVARPEDDTASLVDAAVRQLPEPYRSAVLLCDLGGLTRDRAAAELGVPPGTVASRLSRGRALLAEALTRQGVTLGAGMAVAVPAELVAGTVRLGVLVTAGEAAVPPAVGALLTRGGRTVFPLTLWKLAAGLLALGGAAVALGTGGPKPPADPPAPPDKPAAVDLADAERIGLKAHADAAALQKLPSFEYRCRTRWGFVEAMRAEDRCSLPELLRAQTGPISQKRGEGLTWYEFEFAWDETRFIGGTLPGDADLGINHRFGTRTDGWERSEAKDHSRVRFNRAGSIRQYWWTGEWQDSGFHMNSNYLKLGPGKWWWGESHNRTSQSLTHQPLAGATWTMLPAEPFAGEDCQVVEVSSKHGRFQRLWVGKESGRVRGVLTFYSDPDDYGALVRFDDYCEVAPGVWVPFAETRTFSWGSETAKGKHQLIRNEVRVTTARPGVDLSERYAALLPKPGDPVQDQRFASPVNTKFDPNRPDADVQKEADAEYAKRLADAELVKGLLKPLDKLVGQPAPPLPADGWVGGPRPDLAGKPHLRHFWATWCGPCKNDLPLLAKLAADGVAVVGLHPAGTPAAEVAKAVDGHKLPYPTLVAAGGDRATVAGHPVGLFPYCVVVDAAGTVAGHGSLADVMQKHGRALWAKP